METSADWQDETETFISQHRLNPVCNDYTSGGLNNAAVRSQFQPLDRRPVLLVINCVSNSPSHAQWQLLVNHAGNGDLDFNPEITVWRGIIDSVQAPPPRLAQSATVSNHFQFTLPAQRGQTNRVEVSSNLREWSMVTNFIGTNATVTVREPVAAGQRFYRVVRP